jgi:hypothetical protein
MSLPKLLNHLTTADRRKLAAGMTVYTDYNGMVYRLFKAKPSCGESTSELLEHLRVDTISTTDFERYADNIDIDNGFEGYM